jgi:O-antigen/teichoic acid export membrane protein
LSYAAYSTFGVSDAVTREIPFCVGKGDMAKAVRIKEASFSFMMFMALFIAVMIGVYAFIARAHISKELFWGLLFASGLVILQQLNNVIITLLRSFQKFGLVSKQMFLSAIVNAVLVAVLSYRFQIFGFMSAMCLSFLFNIVYIFCHERFSFHFRFDFQLIRNLMGYGFPLMLLSLMDTFIQTFDRLVITRYWGLEMLGVYSVATMVNGFVYSFPNSVCVVLIPSVFEKFGKTEDRNDLRNYLLESDYVFCVLMPLLIGAGWFLVPSLIHWALPKFSQGIPALKYLVLSSFFMAVSQAYGNFLVVIRKQLRLFPVGIATILFSVALNAWVILKGGRIEDVARVQVAVYGINFTLLFFLSHSYLKISFSSLKQYWAIILKFSWMLLLLFLISKYICPVNPILRGVSQILVLIVFYIPPLARVEKKYHLVSLLMQKFGLKTALPETTVL